MTTFEIIILVSFYIFTIVVEISFLADYYEGRQMSQADNILCLLATIFAPIFLAVQLGDIIYQKLRQKHYGRENYRLGSKR